MYTRQLKTCPASFVKDGKPVFGTFLGHSERLDIRGIKQPYITLPTFVSNLRIKSRISYFFNIGAYIGCIEFFDAKMFGFSEVCFWNKNTKQRFVYRSVMGPRRRFVPHSLIQAITANYSKRRYTRLSWDRKNDKLSVIFNLHGNNVRPGSNGALISKFSGEQVGEIITSSPAPTSRRSSVHYMLSTPLHGAISQEKKHAKPKTMTDCEGSALFEMSRTYMKFRSNGELITGIGTLNDKQISFRLQVTSQDAVENDAYNANVLFYGGTVTPLPPVVITHPYGKMEKWIIQDTENMVDLTFTPISDNPNVISAFVLRSEYHTIYGHFEGTLLTADGEKLSFRSLPGISKKFRIRL